MRELSRDWSIADREYERMESRRGRRHAFARLEPAKTALVVIDMVPFFVDDSQECREAVPGITGLADLVRVGGGTVAWVVPANTRPTATEIEFRGRRVAELYAATGGPEVLRDRLWPEFEVSADDIVVEKIAASAFFPGRCDLPARLEARGIDTVLVAGTLTSVCCESAVRDAFTLGYRVIMVADLNIGGDFGSRSATFTVVYRSFGDVRTSDEVAALLAEE